MSTLFATFTDPRRAGRQTDFLKSAFPRSSYLSSTRLILFQWIPPFGTKLRVFFRSLKQKFWCVLAKPFCDFVGIFCSHFRTNRDNEFWFSDSESWLNSEWDVIGLQNWTCLLQQLSERNKLPLSIVSHPYVAIRDNTLFGIVTHLVNLPS